MNKKLKNSKKCKDKLNYIEHKENQKVINFQKILCTTLVDLKQKFFKINNVKKDIDRNNKPYPVTLVIAARSDP